MTIAPDAPSGELAASGQGGPESPNPELFARAREAVAALRGRGRQANGQAAPGNTLALRTGVRSALLLGQPDVAAWHREQVEAITTDLGGASELSALQQASVREVARLDVILAALGDELLTGGVLTGKGATRAATATYLQTLDRFLKMASAVGLQRRSKPVNPLDAVRAAVLEANR